MKRLQRSPLPGLAVLAAAVVVACGPSPSAAPAAAVPTAVPSVPTPTAAPQPTAVPIAQSPAFDQLFIDMMVPHHEGALGMARIAQQRAERPELRQLADDILRSQDTEISRMRQWRREWFGSDATPPMSKMPMLGGMASMAAHSGQTTMDMGRRHRATPLSERTDRHRLYRRHDSPPPECDRGWAACATTGDSNRDQGPGTVDHRGPAARDRPNAGVAPVVGQRQFRAARRS